MILHRIYLGCINFEVTNQSISKEPFISKSDIYSCRLYIILIQLPCVKEHVLAPICALFIVGRTICLTLGEFLLPTSLHLEHCINGLGSFTVFKVLAFHHKHMYHIIPSCHSRNLHSLLILLVSTFLCSFTA